MQSCQSSAVDVGLLLTTNRQLATDSQTGSQKPDNREPTTVNRQPATDRREPIKRDLTLEVLSSFGEARLPVTGASMLPCLWPGDVLTVRRQPIDAVACGDVVLAHRAGRFVAHRVVGKVRVRAGTLLVTQGDRLDRADPPVAAEDLLGRVTAIERGQRSISPGLTLRRRLGAWVLRRSDFATRALLYVRKVQHRVTEIQGLPDFGRFFAVFSTLKAVRHDIRVA
jgi:hypothetical protein